MATLYQKERSPYWWMRFTHQGKRYQESTQETHKATATLVMQKRIAEIKGFGSYWDLFNHLQHSINKQPINEQDLIRRELARKLLADTLDKLKLPDAFPLYRAKPKKRNPSERTIQGYENDWNRFIKWLADEHSKLIYVHEITPEIAEAYMTHLWSTGISERTFNRILVFFRSMFTLIMKNAGLTENAWNSIDKLQLNSVSKKMLTPEQLEQVCSEAKGDLKKLFLIGLYTGMRLGDAVTLKWEEIKGLGTDKALISKIPSKTKKLQKTINVPLHQILHAVLIETKKLATDDSPYVLPDLAELYLRNGSNLSRPIQQVFENAGIETTATIEGKRSKNATVLYGFHSLRHSFVSLCHANKVPQIAVMELVGHNTAAVHAIYQHASEDMKRQAIAALPDVTNHNDINDQSAH